MMLQKMMILGSIAKMKLRDLFTDEKGEVNIVAIVILIGIAVILALILKIKLKHFWKPCLVQLPKKQPMRSTATRRGPLHRCARGHRNDSCKFDSPMHIC